MKCLLLSLFIFFGSLAHGERFPLYPILNFPYPVTIDQLCTDGENIRTLKSVSQCTSYLVKSRKACRMGEAETCRTLQGKDKPRGIEYVREELYCAQTVTEPLSLKRTYWEPVCNKLAYAPAGEGDGSQAYCLEPGLPRPQVRPLTYRVDMVELNGEMGLVVKDTINFYIPPCPGVPQTEFDEQMYKKYTPRHR